MDEYITTGAQTSGAGLSHIFYIRVGNTEAKVIGAILVAAIDIIRPFGGTPVTLLALVATRRKTQIDAVASQQDRLAIYRVIKSQLSLDLNTTKKSTVGSERLDATGSALAIFAMPIAKEAERTVRRFRFVI